MIGACIAGIPLALLLLSQYCSNGALKQQILQYEKLEEQGIYLSVWTLNKDISARKKVARADLEKNKVWVSESEHIDTAIDIQQIIGKKTKIALKKGTVIQADLFYNKKEHKNNPIG